MNGDGRHILEAPRWMPLRGALIGTIGGGVYWIGAQLWPTSIAVVLAMLVTALLSARANDRPHAVAGSRADGSPAADTSVRGLLILVFTVLIKYNALMALSAAKLPFLLPANLALGLIMIAGEASSRALSVSVLAAAPQTASQPVSLGDFAVAFAFGFTPAALIGLPGLIGAAAAIAARIAHAAFLRRRRTSLIPGESGMTQQLTEVCFYLGVLASWTFI
jgi:adenosylcobinamide-GDP ribazoletransferase